MLGRSRCRPTRRSSSYVAVEDPDATLDRARHLGGRIRVGPDDIPGIGRFGALEDPTGALLAVMKATPAPRGDVA